MKLEELYKTDTNEIAAVKTKITQTKKELEKIEERYATGKIDSLIYNKYSEKCKQEILELDEKLTNPNLSSSNIEKCIKNGLKTALKLSKIWNSGDLDSK